ncbi:MAG: VWA domain-containing protein [Leptolinea sp.]|jgi:VWFA-related protein|nr:VWA domain-containing protein [Leptolinea sp.]
MKRIRSVQVTLFLVIITCLLMGFTPLASSYPQNSGVTIKITQVDNSKFPLVTVYVSAVNAKGEPIAVNAKDLVIREGDQVVPANFVEGAGAVGPLTTLLVMDVSGSMQKMGKIDSAKAVAKEYINQMRDGDKAGIILFNTMVKTYQVIKEDRSALLQAIDLITPGGDTAMYDALISGVNMLNGVTGRKAILVYTDGLDNRSKSSAEQVISTIGTGGLTISTVGFGDASQGLNSQEALDEGALKYLAEKSGGLYGYAANREQLSALYASFGRSMQSEYSLTYRSPYGLRNGINRSLTVTLESAAGGMSQSGASATYNPGGLIPEVPISGSWSLFFGLLVFLGLMAAVPILLPLAQEKLPALPKSIRRSKASVKLKEPKKVAIKFKN